MRTMTKGILAGLGLMLASSTSVMAQELTIFLDQPKRELLLVVVRAHVGHVQGQV